MNSKHKVKTQSKNTPKENKHKKRERKYYETMKEL